MFAGKQNTQILVTKQSTTGQGRTSTITELEIFRDERLVEQIKNTSKMAQIIKEYGAQEGYCYMIHFEEDDISVENDQYLQYKIKFNRSGFGNQKDFDLNLNDVIELKILGFDKGGTGFVGFNNHVQAICISNR